MFRGVLIVLLTLGTVAGFGHGFRALHERGCERRTEFERHVADVCVQASREQIRADSYQQRYEQYLQQYQALYLQPRGAVPPPPVPPAPPPPAQAAPAPEGGW